MPDVAELHQKYTSINAQRGLCAGCVQNEMQTRMQVYVLTFLWYRYQMLECTLKKVIGALQAIFFEQKFKSPNANCDNYNEARELWRLSGMQLIRTPERGKI